jgi:SEC-C motif domain protein
VNNSDSCYCGSTFRFQDCCQKYIIGTEKAPTALALMKSRYSAYATHQADYLWETTHPSQRKYYSKNDILNWATSNDWQKLEILSFTENTVEFKAYFLDKNKQNQMHYEFSTFVKEKEEWFYFDGKFDEI